MMACFPGIENTPMFKKLEHCMATRTHALLLNEFTFPDNSIGWFELRIEPVPEGLFILSMDVTERRRAEVEKDKYIQGMEDMLFMTSHKVRQPIVNIMGMSNILNTTDNSKEDLIKITEYMRHSVDSLDKFTRELTDYIVDLKRRGELTKHAS